MCKIESKGQARYLERKLKREKEKHFIQKEGDADSSSPMANQINTQNQTTFFSESTSTQEHATQNLDNRNKDDSDNHNNIVSENTDSVTTAASSQKSPASCGPNSEIIQQSNANPQPVSENENSFEETPDLTEEERRQRQMELDEIAARALMATLNGNNWDASGADGPSPTDGPNGDTSGDVDHDEDGTRRPMRTGYVEQLIDERPAGPQLMNPWFPFLGGGGGNNNNNSSSVGNVDGRNLLGGEGAGGEGDGAAGGNIPTYHINFYS